MALQTQLVNLDFAGGMDENTSDRHVVPGKMISLKNGRFRKVGEISKRNGNTLVTSTNEALSMTANARLGVFEEELLVFDQYTDGRTFCSSYSSKTGQFEKMGVSPEAVMTLADAHFDSAQMYQQDWASGNSTIVTVWSNAVAGSNGSIYYMIRDSSTGTMITKPVKVNATTTYRKPRVVFCGTTAIITCQNNANIVAFTIDPTTFAISAGSNVRTNNVAYGDYDISATSSIWALAYQKTGAGADLVVYTYNSALAQQTTGASAYVPSIGPSVKFPISCSLDGGSLWVVFVDQDAGAATNLPIVTWFNPSTLAEANAPITGADIGGAVPCRQATIVGIDSGRCGYAIEADSASGANSDMFGNNRVYFGAITRSGTALTNAIPYTSRFLPYCSIGSRMFTQSIVVGGGRAFMVGVMGTTTADIYLDSDRTLFDYSLVLVDPKLTSNDSATADIVRPVAITAPRFALWDRIAMNINPVGPCSVIATSNGLETLCRTRVGNGSWVAALGYRGAHGLSSARINFSFTNKFQGVIYGELACFSGGINSFYDGRNFAEIGFVGSPDMLGAGGAAAGGALVDNGTYAWVACYVFYDERGNVHRSAVSLPFSKVIGAGNTKYTVRVPNLLISQTNDAASTYLPRVGIELYRTTNGTSAPYYLVTPSPVAMDTTFRYTNIVDTYADGTIALGNKIYTTGNIIENQMPPSFLSMVAHRGRLFGIDGKRVWFSKQLVSGEGPAFADEFTLDFDADLDLTALGELDDKVIVFSRNTIHALTGRGPDDTTGGNDFELTRISVDRGCIEPRSVVQTNMGLMFQSDIGIYLLTRAMEVQYIGNPVSDTLASYPYITSATIHPTDYVVYFTCNQQSSGGTGQGVRIVYNYNVGQWAYDALWCRDSSSTAITQGPVMSAVAGNGVYYWQDGHGYVYKEVTDGSKFYDDNSTFVVTELKLAPVNLDGINGFQRARAVHLKVKDYTSPSLTFEGYSGDEAVASTSQVFTPALSDMRLDVKNQLSSTFKIVMRDAQNGSLSTGKGISFVGIAFEVGVYPRGNRLPAANRKG